MFCQPRTSGIWVKDYDGDGTTEFVFAYSQHSSTKDRVTVSYGTNTYPNFVLERTANVSGIATTSGASSQNCHNDFDISASMSLLDIKGSANQLETVIGVQSGSTFRMHSFDAGGNKINQYPKTQSADGQLISNPFTMNAFGTTGGKDFCVLGYKEQSTIGSAIDLLCASEVTPLFSTFGIFNVSSEEFVAPIDGFYNLTRNNGYRWSSIVHAGDYTGDPNPGIGKNTDEIVTPFGVYKLEFDQTAFFTFLPGITQQSDLVLEWENPVHVEGAMIPIDYHSTSLQNPLNDFLYMTSTNIYYMDDGLTNQPARIAEYTINPCIDAAWKLNTPVEVTIRVFDNDGDNVRAGGVLYEGEPGIEERKNQTLFFQNGTTFSFTFTADTLTTSSTLSLYGDDTGTNNSVDKISLPFTVTGNGVEKGDCKTTKTIKLAAGVGVEEVIASGELHPDDNVIRNSVYAAADNFGVGSTIIWIIVMMAITIGMFGIPMFRNIVGLVAVAIVNFFLLILGTILGFISTAIIISIVVVASALVSVFLWKVLTGGD